MAKIINPFERSIRLPTGHVVPAAGELVTTNAVLNMTDNAPSLNAMARAGQITLEFDPESPGGDAPIETVVIEATPEVTAVADTLDLLAESVSPPRPKPPRAPRPTAAEPTEP